MIFITEAVPLSNMALGAHGISRRIVHALKGDLNLIIARRLSHRNSKKEITDACDSVPVFLLPDLAVLGVRRFFSYFTEWLNAILFLLAFPVVMWRLRRYRGTRVFALLGADATFLPVLCCTALFYPTDVYLMDDVESAALMFKRPVWAKIARRLESFLYAHCHGVYVLSEGFAEHIRNKYAIDAKLLPLPTEVKPALAVEYATKEFKYVTFIGAISQIYMDALRDFYLVLLDWNKINAGSLKLRIIVYHRVEQFLATLPNSRSVEVHYRLPHDQMIELLKQSWACLLPYSFKRENQLMVSTSFSCKILDYFQSGRPIIAFGPDYASIPRYFKANDLPFLATSPAELSRVFASIECADIPQVVARYHALWHDQHSLESFRRRLGMVSQAQAGKPI
jgi:glycosyltransferase involved in cell wall biosynthesis